jgi:hypothetical protein
MTLEQALLRIIELQDEVARLKAVANKPLPYNPLECSGGCVFPSPWFGTMPPSCMKCGRQSQPNYTVTCTTF